MRYPLNAYSQSVVASLAKTLAESTQLSCGNVKGFSSIHQLEGLGQQRTAAILSIVHFGDIFMQMLLCVSLDPSYNLSRRPGQEEDSFPNQ